MVNALDLRVTVDGVPVEAQAGGLGLYANPDVLSDGGLELAQSTRDLQGNPITHELLYLYLPPGVAGGATAEVTLRLETSAGGVVLASRDVKATATVAMSVSSGPPEPILEAWVVRHANGGALLTVAGTTTSPLAFDVYVTVGTVGDTYLWPDGGRTAAHTGSSLGVVASDVGEVSATLPLSPAAARVVLDASRDRTRVRALLYPASSATPDAAIFPGYVVLPLWEVRTPTR